MQMRQIIFGSGSPRRRELLERLRVAFTVVPSQFEEYLDDARSVADIARNLGLVRHARWRRATQKQL